MTLIRFNIPQRIALYGLLGTSLDVSTSFFFKRIQVGVCLPGGEITEFPSPHDHRIIYSTRKADTIRIVLRDSIDHPCLRDYISTDRRNDFIKLVTRLALRILTVIRHVGDCPEVPVTLPEHEVMDRIRFWKFETSSDGDSWEKLQPIDTEKYDLFSFGLGLGLGLFSDFPQTGWLDVRHWPRIAETLEEDKKIQPEDEFYTNAKKHLSEENLRLAVLEAVICLEIVLTEFLRMDMSVSKGFKKKQVESFLTNTGLTARLTGVLGYALDQSYLKDMDLVLKTVHWRNQITHNTGNIPEGIPHDTVKNGINAVLRLAKALAERRDGITAQPKLNKVAALLTKAWDNTFMVRIRQLPWHEVIAEVTHFTVPTEDTMNRIATETSRLLSEGDKRFVCKQHLRIAFQANGESVGYFTGEAILIPAPKNV